MSCITELLKLKGDQEFLPINSDCVIEGGGVYNGYEYIITFTLFGTRCGYVAIPDDKIPVTEEMMRDGIECHGGITFQGTTHGAKELLKIPCSDLWIGFDAAHFMDLPCAETLDKYFKNSPDIDFLKRLSLAGREGRHRDYQYMEDQCKSIIDQLIQGVN